MKFLFIHQHFPGQFKFLAPELARQGHDVRALLMRKVESPVWQGVSLFPYAPNRGSSREIHPWVSDFETKTIRGEACFRAALKMKQAGYAPDVIIAHPSWGESLFLKEVWPEAKLGIYCEFFYHRWGGDVGFDPEFDQPDEATACRLRLKNLNHLAHFDIADAGISPTEWQASTFPPQFRDKISVIFDGIDTDAVMPDPAVRVALPDGTTLSREDEVVTFVNRNLEPYRGYHVFMRALPALLKARPRAQVLIVGGNGVSYGARAPEGKTWKDIFIAEVRSKIPEADWARVHFLGYVPYEKFIPLLQLSTVHVYLTYPFVLSWSLLEAMSAGCVIVASDTAPLREAILHGDTGRLVDFFDAPALAAEVAALLSDPAARQRLAANARAFARSRYDLKMICLPAQLRWVQALAEGRTPP